MPQNTENATLSNRVQQMVQVVLLSQKKELGVGGNVERLQHGGDFKQQ